MIVSRSASDTDLGSFTSFHSKLLLMEGSYVGRAQFWILRMDQIQHLGMQTMFQIPQGLDERLPIFLVEFEDGCARPVEGVVDFEQEPLNCCCLPLVHAVGPRVLNVFRWIGTN